MRYRSRVNRCILFIILSLFVLTLAGKIIKASYLKTEQKKNQALIDEAVSKIEYTQDKLAYDLELFLPLTKLKNLTDEQNGQIYLLITNFYYLNNDIKSYFETVGRALFYCQRAKNFGGTLYLYASMAKYFLQIGADQLAFEVTAKMASFGSIYECDNVLSRIQQKPHVLPVLLSLFFLLLPQALMFNTRVFFLLTLPEQGGLGCSVQDVGFAQGTIGVLAFSLGIIGGKALMKKYSRSQMFWWTAIVLTLSPLSYMLMAWHPQLDNMLMLCLMTFFAQLCFGFGLNVCSIYVPYISEQRYRNTTNYLYMPLVISLMLVPLALSGWLSQWLGYRAFFAFCAICAPVAWVVSMICKTKQILTTYE